MRHSRTGGSSGTLGAAVAGMAGRQRWHTRLGALSFITTVLVSVPSTPSAMAAPAPPAPPPDTVGTVFYASTSPATPAAYSSSGTVTSPGSQWGFPDAYVAGGVGSNVLLYPSDGTVFKATVGQSGAVPVTAPAPDPIDCRSATDSQGCLTVDPTGTQVAYVGADHQIDISNLNAPFNTRSLGSATFGAVAPVWSPDGKWIAYSALDPAGPRELSIISPNGSTLFGSSGPLVMDPHNDLPGSYSWFPDSQRLAEISITSVPGASRPDDALAGDVLIGHGFLSDISVISFAQSPLLTVTPLHVGFNTETNGNVLANAPWSSFYPERVAVSPTAGFLAVEGIYDECSQPVINAFPDFTPGVLYCGANGNTDPFGRPQTNYNSQTQTRELAVIRSTGGKFSPSSAVEKFGTFCFGAVGVTAVITDCAGQAPATPPNVTGGYQGPLSWSGVPPFKIIVYVNTGGPTGHAFVQFRTEEPPGPAIQTFGKFPAFPCDRSLLAPGPNQTGNFLKGIWDGPACITAADGATTWTHRIIYIVTKAQYNAGLAYVRSQLALPDQGGYSLALKNCMGFAGDVAQAAGLTLPNYFAGGISGLGLSTPDPAAFDKSLADAGNGAMVNGGLVQATDGSTANGAPDPPVPPDPSSVADLLNAALSDPAGTASTYGIAHNKVPLDPVAIAPGGSFTLHETDTPPQLALYAVDWGDGSTPDLSAVGPNAAGTTSFTHLYPTAGSYPLRMVVLQGNVEEYDATVTVAAGDASSAEQGFTVAAPPTSYQWTGLLVLATNQAALAGSPGPPGIGTATAGPGSASVAFTPPNDGGDSAITDYLAVATDTTTPANGRQTGNGTASPILVTGLTSGDTYTFVVLASNDEGPGRPSDASNAVTIPAALTPQTITFTSSPPAGATVGGTYPPTATGGGSGNSVVFSIDPTTTNAACSLSGADVTFDHTGNCVVDANQAGNGLYTPAPTLSQSLPVGKAGTVAVVSVQATSITASVTPVAPAMGTPTGVVTFSVDGIAVGTVALTNRMAVLDNLLSPGQTWHVSAVYSGDGDYTGSSASTARRDPSITATLSSAHRPTRYGWYRSPVTVTFRCAIAGAPLTGPCPAPVTFGAEAAGVSVIRTITASDGGSATAIVHPINIDRSPPTVQVRGAQPGHIYGRPRHLTCHATDAVSGIASCVIVTRRHIHGLVTGVYYQATATDRAGNTSTRSGSYFVKRASSTTA